MDGRQLVPQAVFAGFTYTQKNCTGQGPMRGNRRRAVLFGAFVHLFQEYLNNFPRHISFLHLILEGKDILEGLGLVVCVLPFQANLLVDIFDLLLFRGLNFTLSIVLVQVCLLLWRAKLMVGLHKEPSALFVLWQKVPSQLRNCCNQQTSKTSHVNCFITFHQFTCTFHRLNSHDDIAPGTRLTAGVLQINT